MAKRIQVGGRIESKEVGGIVTGAAEILDDAKGKKQSVINGETDDELVRLDQSKQDNLTFDNAPTEGSDNPVKSGGVYAVDKAMSDAIEAILLLIPSAASALNKLVDTSMMNSSISTATATFRGTYNVVTDLSLTVDATHEQIAAALDNAISTADNNDYAFVQVPVSAESTDIRRTERYKFNGTAWGYEYDLNTSGFTASQWAAINSGITLALVGKLIGLPTSSELQALLGQKQDTLTFDNVPTAGSANPVKSGGVYSAINDEKTAREQLEQTVTGIDGRVENVEEVIPTGAAANNKLVANNSMEAYVTSIIEAITASFTIATADGHINLTLTQTNGRVASLTLISSDIASAQALTALTGRVTTAEGNITMLGGRMTTAEGNITTLGGRVSTNETDIANLQQLYNNLQQSKPVPVTALPETGQQGVIYRLAGTTSYSDYMWNGSTWVLMATYNNAIDDMPTAGSDNLVKSGGVRKQTAPLYCVNDILDIVMIQFREFEYPQISNGKVNPAPSQNLSILVLDATKLTSLIVKDAPYNGNNYHGITLTDDENNIIKYGNSSVSFTTEDFVGTTKAFIVFRNRNASSYLPTKVVANGYPVTINAFSDAFDLAFDKKGFNWINNEKFLNPINDAFKIWEHSYPAVDAGKVNPMPHASINSYRIDLSIAPINSIVASGLNHNMNNYHALTLTDVDYNIISYINADEVSISDFGEARYCWLAGKQNIINIIINGFPYTNYSFANAVNGITMLTGKMMWTLCDSLGVNTWQPYFKNITGINFRNDLNIKRDFPLSVGGTSSWPKDQDGTQARALRLASYKNIYPIDYIFIENVNDGRALVDSSGNPRPYVIGTKDDKPFMLSMYKTISPQSFASNSEARTWIENNWSTFLGYFSVSEKKAGVIARIPITPNQSNPNGSKITFSGTVANEGQISFDWEGYTYAITAEVGDTPQNIVDKFLNYQFGAGSVDVDGGNGSLIVFDDYTGGTSRISNYNGGNTGITATIVDAAGVSDYCWAFYGDTALEFDSISNWNNADAVTIWSVYKGLISYMQRTFPESNIYWLIPFSLNPGPATDNPYKDANGNYDMNLYKNYPGYKNRINLFSIQREVCEYLGIPVIDLFTKSGMGISNIETYIPYNDVHPRAIGYKRYAEYIAKLMGIG